MINKIYYDRWGKEHCSNEKSRFHHRKGAFLILKTKDSILFNKPNYAPDVLDLPGGGIEEGEAPLDAARREFYEETEMKIPSNIVIERTLSQFVNFYAEHDDEYWDYEQTFFFVTKNTEHLYFDNIRNVKEGQCIWLNLNELGHYNVHFMHNLILKRQFPHTFK